jgi:TrpR-related protein YerC/YecD
MNQYRKTDINKLNELWRAILKLKTPKECASFFRDLCTLEELRALSERWQSAVRIAQGEPYRDIAKDLKMSTTTVARVAHWLNHGKGGYKLVLKRLKILK